jgi:YVTN family beta-propeller protein
LDIKLYKFFIIEKGRIQLKTTPPIIYSVLAYVANPGNDTVSIIDTETNIMIYNILVRGIPYRLAITPDGMRVYVTNYGDLTISVIDTMTNTVTATIFTGDDPAGLAITPDGTRVYVGN